MNLRRVELATVTKTASVTSTTIYVRDKTFNLPLTGANEDIYWDAWVWVDGFTDIGFTARCTNCQIT